MRRRRDAGKPAAITVETSDLDEARETCGEHLYPRSLRLVDPAARFSARFAFLHLPHTTVADISYGAAVAGTTGDLGSYHVNLPLGGSFTADQDGRPIHGDTGRAGVYRPVGENVLHRSSADCRLLAVKVDAPTLEDQLAALLDAPVRGPLRFDGEMDLRRDPGRGLAALIRLVGGELGNPTGLVHQPIVAAPLEESLILGLLHAVGHQYHDLLSEPVRAGGADRRVIRAIEAIQAEPRRPFTTGLLAEIAEVGVRRLRRQFHQQVGMAPMAYVRRVRMARAHAELLDADPAHTTVGAIARRWGFVRPARFAQRYRTLYGASPTATLHR